MLDGKPTAFFGLFLACLLIAGWEPFVFLMTVTVASKILEYSQLSLFCIFKSFCIYNLHGEYAKLVAATMLNAESIVFISNLNRKNT